MAFVDSAGRRGNKRTKIERERDLVRIAELYLQGKSQLEIAEDISRLYSFSITQQQISYDLRKIRDLWIERSLRDFDAAKAEELARLDALEKEYFSAWRASGGMREKTITERTGSGETSSNKNRARIERVATIGDPRFLEGVRWVIDRRIRLLGLDSPIKSALTDPDGKSVPISIREVIIRTATRDDDPDIPEHGDENPGEGE